MLSLQSIGHAWNIFFFTPELPYTLAVFRILFGAVLFINALLILKDVKIWYGPTGLFPYEQYVKTYGSRMYLNLFRLLPPTDKSTYLLAWLNALAAAALTLGFCTPISSALAFLVLRSFHGRNPFVERGNDQVMRLMTFLLVFSHAGSALSIDHHLQLLNFGATHAGLIVPWCTRLIQLQVAIIYVRNAYWKATGSMWLKGTAVYYALAVDRFRRCQFPAVLHKPLLLRLSAWGCLALEFALGTFIWVREFRLPLIAAGICMHALFDVFLNVELFSLVMMICLLIFVPPEIMQSWLQQLHLIR